MTRPSLQSRVVHLDNAVHHGELRQEKVSLIVMHCTEGGSAQSTIEYLNTTDEKTASYHYIIERDGTIYRMTAPNIVAYHAGDSAWPNPVPATPANPEKPNGGRSVNRRSIGIAWAHQGREQLTVAAYTAPQSTFNTTTPVASIVTIFCGPLIAFTESLLIVIDSEA